LKSLSKTAPLLKNVNTETEARQPGIRRGWLYDGLALLFFVGLSLVFLGPLTSNLAESAINEGDDLQQMWSMGWVIHALTTDPANLFKANIFWPYPNTLAYSDHLLVQALFSMPIVLTTGNLVLGYNLGMVLSFALSGWGSYLLVKDLTSSRAAGLLSGLIFAYAPYKVGHLSQLNLLSTQWIPFCFLFLHRLLLNGLSSAQKAATPQESQSTNRSFATKLSLKQSAKKLVGGWKGWGLALTLTLFFVLNSLSSTYYLFFMLPLLALYFVFFYLAQRQWPSLRVLLQLALAFGLAFIIMLPTFLPYLQVSAEQAAERTPREIEQFSANYRFYLGVPESNFFWGSTLSKYGGLGGAHQLFPGALALLFSLIAISWPLLARFRGKHIKFAPTDTQTQRVVARDRRWQPYIFLALAVFALLMSFGLVLKIKGLEIPMPYRLFYDYVPGWKGLRAAMRYGVFVLLALSVTAGFGLALILNYVKLLFDKRNGFGLVVPLTFAGLTLLGTFWEYRSDITRINPAILPNPPQVYRWLAEPSRAGVVLELPMAKPPDLPSIRNYYSTFNWQPTLGGESGYLPPVYNDLYTLSQDITAKENLELFQGLGVRWLVYHLADENTPLAPAEWQKIEAKLKANPKIKLVQDFPQDQIKVYELARDPWMEQLIKTLPDKAEVIVSDYRRNQPVSIELIETLMRGHGLTLYGNDRAGYRFLTAPPTGRPVAYGLFSADENPRPYGFTPNEVSWSGHGLKLYSRKQALTAAYDLSRDSKLVAFNTLTGPLELEVNQNELKFNGKSLGSGNNFVGKASLSLQLVSFGPQTIRLGRSGQETLLELKPGLTTWAGGPFQPGEKLRIEPAFGATLYLNRAELIANQQVSSLAPINQAEAVLLTASSRVQNGHFINTFELYAPKIGEGATTSYLLSLDTYRKPWGTHPSGHFGVWSVALEGGEKSRRLEFDFDPVAKTSRVTLEGLNLDVGADVIRPGDGDWATFIALRRAEAKNPKNFELVGVSRLYEFNLNGPQLRDLNLLPGRQLTFLPPVQ